MTAGQQLQKVLVIGCSAGGVEALKQIFKDFKPSDQTVAIIALHVGALTPMMLLHFLQDLTGCEVKEAESQELIEGGRLYFAPSGYHLLISPDGRFELNVDDLVNYSRPSIDVLFESAAEAFKEKLLGVVLTGANHDGAEGAKRILEYGGRVLIQDPAEAAYPTMPRSAQEATRLSEVHTLKMITDVLRHEAREVGL